jgi:hypothetical protein
VIAYRDKEVVGVFVAVFVPLHRLMRLRPRDRQVMAVTATGGSVYTASRGVKTLGTRHHVEQRRACNH